MQHLVTFEALLNLYKELKHSLYKFYKGNASIPYIKSTVTKTLDFYKIFFDRKNFPKNIFDNLGRSEIFPGIQKSHL